MNSGIDTDNSIVGGLGADVTLVGGSGNGMIFGGDRQIILPGTVPAPVEQDSCLAGPATMSFLAACRSVLATGDASLPQFALSSAAVATTLWSAVPEMM